MSAARLAAVVVATWLVALAGAQSAVAQPPAGIVRPQNESSLSQRELGSQLYAGNCVSCHGIGGRGVGPRSPQRGSADVDGLGPSLRGVGELTADFYVRSGYMPLASPRDQPRRGRVRFREREIRALVQYVGSLGRGPGIPHPDPRRGRLSQGLELFTEHCAGCHQVAARGGVVTGARVPPLQDVTARQIAQAVRVGPYLMPKFSEKNISDGELDSIIAYLERAKHPVNQGGWGIGNLGPVPEGMVTWFIAIVAFLGFCVLIGRRLTA